MTELEKNTAWIPYEKNFLSTEQAQHIINNTKSCDDEVFFTREVLNPDEHKLILPPSPPDNITIEELKIN